MIQKLWSFCPSQGLQFIPQTPHLYCLSFHLHIFFLYSFYLLTSKMHHHFLLLLLLITDVIVHVLLFPSQFPTHTINLLLCVWKESIVHLISHMNILSLLLPVLDSSTTLSDTSSLFLSWMNASLILLLGYVFSLLEGLERNRKKIQGPHYPLSRVRSWRPSKNSSRTWVIEKSKEEDQGTQSIKRFFKRTWHKWRRGDDVPRHLYSILLLPLLPLDLGLESFCDHRWRRWRGGRCRCDSWKHIISETKDALRPNRRRYDINYRRWRSMYGWLRINIRSIFV